MLMSSVRFLTKRSFPKGSVNNYFNSSVNLHKIPKVNFSTTKAVCDLEYFEGVISTPIMATPNDSTTSTLFSNSKDFSGKIPDDVWLSKAKQDQLSAYLPGIIDELAAKSASFSRLDNGNRIRRVLEHIMPGGNRFAGVLIAETYKIITPKHKQTPDNLKLAYYLGWCFEIVLETMIIIDDMFDECKTRRNRVSWHELPDVGPSASNDALIIEAGAYYLLRKHFGNLNCYTRILELFNEVTLLASIGQTVDLNFSKDLEKLTFDTYREISQNNTVYLVGYTPIALGMILAGYPDLKAMKEAKTILTDIGTFYIIQNDYYDCFGDPQAMGKVTSDIQQGRCRWPAVIAMHMANPDQKEVMKNNFGREDPKCEAKIIQLYKELNIPQIYEDYSQSLCNRLHEDIEKVKNEDMKKVCEKLFETVVYSVNKNIPVYV